MKDNKSKSLHDLFCTSADYVVYCNGYSRLFTTPASASTFASEVALKFPNVNVYFFSFVTGRYYSYTCSRSGSLVIKSYEVRPL